VKSKTWRFIHKWTAIFIGVFILLWTISGLVMVLPGEWFNSKPLISSQAATYEDAIISPEEASESLGQHLGQKIEVAGMTFRSILGELYYLISLEDASTYLVNVVNGNILAITPQVAEEIGRSAIPTRAELTELERLDSHDFFYPFGPLPTYRLKFADNSRDIYYVSMIDGVISKSTSATRVRAMISSLHTFEPIVSLFNKHRTRDLLLVITSLIAIVTAITGYYLAVLPLLRKRGKNNKT
jgi:hypothetical protein